MDDIDSDGWADVRSEYASFGFRIAVAAVARRELVTWRPNPARRRNVTSENLVEAPTRLTGKAAIAGHHEKQNHYPQGA